MTARHILIVGGGMVGMTTAYRLEKKLHKQIRQGEVQLTLVDPQSYMTYQSFLPEAGAGSLEPRHVVVPLRRVLRVTDVITGRVTGIDHGRRCARIEPHVGDAYDLEYDELVVGPGSISRTVPIPGLAEVGVGFKNIEEAIYLRNRVLERLDAAASMEPDDPARQRALSFLFIGGGYSGVEAMAELEDMARAVAEEYYDDVDPRDMRWVLIDVADRILPEVGEEMGEHGVRELRNRGVEVKLGTALDSVEGGHVVLSDGTEFDADTVVWTAGVKPHPMLRQTDLPLDDKGRVRTRPDLRVEGMEYAWAAGDSAAVPDLTGPEGATTSPSAQHALRQAKTLADNIVRCLQGKPPENYRHKYIGSVASLGLHKGVAQVYGIKLRGMPAWFMHRSYHVGKMPTFNRKLRIIMDWSLALFFKRDVVSLGAFARPRAAFERSAVPQQQRPDMPAAPTDAEQPTAPRQPAQPG